MKDYSTKEIYCPECGHTEKWPFCCGQDMELDETLFFCNICGKEKTLPKCCGCFMKVREKELSYP
ncbi:MAG: hypothetical protein JEY99_18930 [Spirochaetales bacterium]|nr:hypothetical protein [Spirochaetales bacterium]